MAALAIVLTLIPRWRGVDFFAWHQIRGVLLIQPIRPA